LVFLDSAFLIALINKGDANRDSALGWMEIVEGAQIPLLTTEFCLIEVVNFVSSRGHRAVARQLVAALRAGALVTILPCSSALLNRGLVLHAARDDKTWSLTDCIGIVVMQDNGLTDVLTYDHDFVQAGMRALPLE
jgi:predicted nucleic acid-binding protein